MQHTITFALYFDKGYIADPYYPEREELINIQKESGMNRSKSDQKRQQALADHLQRIGMTLADYAALQQLAERPWYREGLQEEGLIIIPSHQWYGCLIQAADLVSATLRPCPAINLRSTLHLGDLATGKQATDGIFKRLVMPKSGTGQPLSNQRSLRMNPYIAQFTATGTLRYDDAQLAHGGETLEDFIMWAGLNVGVGASRKMGWGRFTVEKWAAVVPEGTPARRR